VVCYVNINPSDTIKALSRFQNLINEYFIEIASVAFNGRKTENIASRVNKVDDRLLTCYQQARGVKHYMDIDFDVPKEFDVAPVSAVLAEMGISRYFWVDTRSGYHLLISRDQLRADPQLIVKASLEILKAQGLDGDKHEIILNKNEMIPLPGTYQAGHLVRVLNK